MNEVIAGWSMHHTVTAWIVFNVSAIVILWAFKPRDADEWADLNANHPKIGSVLKMISALGIDPVKLTEALRELLQPTKKD